LRARVARPPKDTIRFEAPAGASRCGGDTGSVLLLASTGGSGVIVWLRRGAGGDSAAAGPWSLLQRGDTVSRRGAMVGLRYMMDQVAHGLSLDSGAVEVEEAARVLTVVVRGTGVETRASGRIALEASFDAVPLGTDTVSCRPRP
jgi:hypothetical protein